jgi:hypothetical protein
MFVVFKPLMLGLLFEPYLPSAQQKPSKLVNILQFMLL